MAKSKWIINDLWTKAKNAKVFTLIGEAVDICKKKWPLLTLSVLVDLVWAFFTTLAVTMLQFPLLFHLQSLMVIAGQRTGGLINVADESADVFGGVASLGTDMDFQTHLHAVFKYLIFMVLAAFAIWLIFQAISWFIAHKMVAGNKSMPFLTYWKNFALESVIFYFASIILIFFSVKMVVDVKMDPTSAISSDIVNGAFLMLFLVVWYFGLICFTLTDKSPARNIKDCFRFGGKRFLQIIQTYIFIFLVLWIVNTILKMDWLVERPEWLLVLGVFIFLPVVCFNRVLLFRTTQEYWPEPAVVHHPKEHPKHRKKHK